MKAHRGDILEIQMLDACSVIEKKDELVDQDVSPCYSDVRNVGEIVEGNKRLVIWRTERDCLDVTGHVFSEEQLARILDDRQAISPPFASFNNCQTFERHEKRRADYIRDLRDDTVVHNQDCEMACSRCEFLKADIVHKILLISKKNDAQRH